MTFLPKCRALNIVSEKGHAPGEMGHNLRKMGMEHTMLKLARGKAIWGDYRITLNNNNDSENT